MPKTCRVLPQRFKQLSLLINLIAYACFWGTLVGIALFFGLIYAFFEFIRLIVTGGLGAE